MKDWGYPRFAENFPENEELAELVAAFTRGDYRLVREAAPVLAAKTEDEAVKRAAELLRARTAPDPSARLFFLLTAALLTLLTVWWMTHDGPPR